MAQESLIDAFCRSPEVAEAWTGAKLAVQDGRITAPDALAAVLGAFRFP